MIPEIRPEYEGLVPYTGDQVADGQCESSGYAFDDDIIPAEHEFRNQFGRKAHPEETEPFDVPAFEVAKFDAMFWVPILFASVGKENKLRVNTFGKRFKCLDPIVGANVCNKEYSFC